MSFYVLHSSQISFAWRLLRSTLIVMSKLSIFSELWRFLRVRKKWWLLPIILLIVVLGLLLIFAQASPLAPFIYTFI